MTMELLGLDVAALEDGAAYALDLLINNPLNWVRSATEPSANCSWGVA